MSTCSICLQECDEPTDLPCGHTFHAQCLVPWLWKQGSCPNCRFSERQQVENEETSMTDIRTVIQELRNQRAEQNRKFASNVRIGKKNDAPKNLQRKVKAYEKCRERIKNTMKEKQIVSKKIKEVNHSYSSQQSLLYKNYLSEYKEIEKKEKQETKQDRSSLSKHRQTLIHDKQRMIELRLEIIDYS